MGAAHFLLPLTEELDLEGEAAGGSKNGSYGEHSGQEVASIVRDAAGKYAAVTNLRLEWRRGPLFERVLGLDIIVVIEEEAEGDPAFEAGKDSRWRRACGEKFGGGSKPCQCICDEVSRLVYSLAASNDARLGKEVFQLSEERLGLLVYVCEHFLDGVNHGKKGETRMRVCAPPVPLRFLCA
jgi:hypothetical protein